MSDPYIKFSVRIALTNVKGSYDQQELCERTVTGAIPQDRDPLEYLKGILNSEFGQTKLQATPLLEKPVERDEIG